MFGRWSKNTAIEETRLDPGEISINVTPGSNELTIAISVRITVDSSPNLRSVLLEVLRKDAVPVVYIDFSGVSYLDISGLATLLEALKAAREHSVKLRVIGISGEARTLAELTQLDTIFRTWGSEVEFR